MSLIVQVYCAGLLCRFIVQVYCAGFRTPACRDYPRALAAGVRKAPRHEIAVGSAPGERRALKGIERCT
jgi:hypothetical protein